MTVVHEDSQLSVLLFATADIKKRNNIVLLSGDTALLIDPPSDQKQKEQISRFTHEKKIWILYSHSHINHIEATQYYDFEKLYAERSLIQDQEFIQANIPQPTHLYARQTVLNVGDTKVQLFNLPGHMKNLSVAYLPTQKILFSSDLLLENSLPLIENAFDYVDSLNKLKKLDINIIIPGHGDVLLNKSVLIRFLYYIETLLEHAKKSASLFELISFPVTCFQNEPYDYIIPEFHRINATNIWEMLHEAGGM